MLKTTDTTNDMGALGVYRIEKADYQCGAFYENIFRGTTRNKY
jgi:hypothetical protein